MQRNKRRRKKKRSRTNIVAQDQKTRACNSIQQTMRKRRRSRKTQRPKKSKVSLKTSRATLKITEAGYAERKDRRKREETTPCWKM